MTARANHACHGSCYFWLGPGLVRAWRRSTARCRFLRLTTQLPRHCSAVAKLGVVRLLAMLSPLPTYRQRQYQCPTCGKGMTLTMPEFYKQIFACPNCGTTGSSAAREQVTLHRTEPSAPSLKPQHTFTRRFHGSYGKRVSPTY